VPWLELVWLCRVGNNVEIYKIRYILNRATKGHYINSNIFFILACVKEIVIGDYWLNTKSYVIKSINHAPILCQFVILSHRIRQLEIRPISKLHSDASYKPTPPSTQLYTKQTERTYLFTELMWCLMHHQV